MAVRLSDQERTDLLRAQQRNYQAIQDARETFLRLTGELADAYARPGRLFVSGRRLWQRQADSPLPLEAEVRDALQKLRSLEKEREKIGQELNPEGQL